MKRELYSLADEEFAFLVNRMGEELRKRSLPHIFVGGTAVQAHVLNRMIETHGLDLVSLVSNPDIRLQDYIRATDDVDLALQFPQDMPDPERARQIYSLCENLEGECFSGTEEHIFKYGLERKGIKRPVLSVSVDDDRRENIAFNISRKPEDLRNLELKFYNEFIDAGQNLVIPYSKGFNLEIQAPRPEHVLATKISHFRAKDTMDMQNLVALMRAVGEKVDIEEIKRIVLPSYEKNFNKFISLVEPYLSE